MKHGFDMGGKIIAIGTALPGYFAYQNDILSFMGRAYNNEQDFRKLTILFHQSGIEKRYSVLPDFGKESGVDFFKPQESQPNVGQRMGVFKKEAVRLAKESAIQAMKDARLKSSDLTHLVTVTCTGLHAPGLGIELVKELNMRDDIFQTSVNFLGCNAAFHALKLADLMASSDPHANVLVSCVELCTIHFQPKNNTDNLLSNTIFGDGAASAIVAGKNSEIPGFKLEGFYSLLLQGGQQLMGWDVNEQSFEMVLNSQLPRYIGNEISTVIERVTSALKVSIDEIAFWAVHPGGRKILEEVKKKLDMDEKKLEQAYQVLKDCGNMSSSTILFVLDKIMKLPPGNKNKTMSIGFGPGLSIDSALLTYVP